MGKNPLQGVGENKKDEDQEKMTQEGLKKRGVGGGENKPSFLVCCRIETISGKGV